VDRVVGITAASNHHQVMEGVVAIQSANVVAQTGQTYWMNSSEKPGVSL